MTLQEMAAKLSGAIADLDQRAARGENVEADRLRLEASLATVEQQMRAAPDFSSGSSELLPAVAEQRAPSRFAGAGASPEVLAAVAAGRDAGGHAMVASHRAAGRSGGGLGAYVTKAMAVSTGSAGGYMVPEELAGEVLRSLKARSVVIASGARTVAVRKQLNLASISSGPSAAYLAENAHAPVSELTLAQRVLLVPRRFTSYVAISLQLLRDAAESPDADALLRAELGENMGLRADLAFLQGTGSGSEPTGIKNTAGVLQNGQGGVPDLGTNGRQIGLPDLRKCVAALRGANAPFVKVAWVMSPRTLSDIEQLTDADGRPLLDSGLLSYSDDGSVGRLLGFPVRTSTQVPTNLTKGGSSDTSYLILGDFSEAWIGEEDGFEINVSTEASYTPDAGTTWVSTHQAEQAAFRGTWVHDFALRRPGVFLCLSGIRPLGAT